MFDQLTRIGADEGGVTQDTLQNAQAVDYLLKNFYAEDCSMRKPIHFATSQVSMNFSAAGGGVGKLLGLGGCNVGESTQLRSGVQTHPRCRISLLQRPFVTVPYLGRGPSNPMMESQLQQSIGYANKKSVNASSEVSYIPISNYPLLPSIQEKVTNPQYLVESWQRGGASTRYGTLPSE